MPNAIDATDTALACELALALSRDAMVVVNDDATVVEANAEACRMFRLPMDELLGSNIHRFRAPAAPSLASMLQDDQTRPMRVLETIMRRANGTIFPVEASVRAMSCDDGTVVIGVLRDITTRRRTALELEFKSMLLDSTTDSVVVHTMDGELRYANRAAWESHGYTQEEFLALPAWGWIAPHHRLRTGHHRQVLDEMGEVRMDSINIRADGTTMPVEVIARRIDFGGEPCALAVVRDVTERHQAEAKIRHMAFHDNLTGLPNRRLFHDRLVEAMADTRHTGLMLTLLFADLDDFKPINDTYGHVVGDKLLAAVAGRLSECIREGDTVARYGGDEFVVLLRDVRSEADAEAIAAKLMAALREPFQVEGLELSVTASVGGITSETGCEDMDALLRSADEAMYRAKDLASTSLVFHVD
jgi:diguanylate cyclase (GGDEF)-like protein/PAS domain S-box-containing protein